MATQFGRKPKDIAGQRFGKLVVIEYVGQSLWRCRCDCGTETITRGYSLRAGVTTSCGCVGRENLKLGRKLRNDLTGQVFGYLTVIAWVAEKERWHCVCQCGKDVYLRSNELLTGRVKSCGCRPKDTPFLELTGKRFGRLIAVKYVGNNSHNSRVWECLCDCGETVYVPAGRLQNGHTKSCGCYHKDRITIHGLSQTKEYKRAYSRQRLERKRLLDSAWNTNLEILLREAFPFCAICGMTEEEHMEKYGTSLHVDHVRPLSAGFGLRPGNAVLLCKQHNGSKNNRQLEDLPKDWQERLELIANEFERHQQGVL